MSLLQPCFFLPKNTCFYLRCQICFRRVFVRQRLSKNHASQAVSSLPKRREDAMSLFLGSRSAIEYLKTHALHEDAAPHARAFKATAPVHAEVERALAGSLVGMDQPLELVVPAKGRVRGPNTDPRRLAQALGLRAAARRLRHHRRRRGHLCEHARLCVCPGSQAPVAHRAHEARL